MEIRKTEKVEKIIEEITDQYTECDKCKQRIKKDSYNAFECTVILKTGYAFPEGGSGEETSVDLCQECGDKLISLLSSYGYRINKRDWDY